MTHAFKQYAQKVNVVFNSKKSQVTIYKAYNAKPPDPCVTINDARVKCVDKGIHLCHLLTANVYVFNMSKCIDDFSRQCNIFLADFKHCSSHIRNIAFQRYCTSCYGTQMLPNFDTNIQDLYTAWRIAIRRVWHLPQRTHNNMLAHVSGMMKPE